MNKNTIHALILWTLLLVVTAILMILLPFQHNSVFWLAGGCTLAMFVLVEIIFWRAFRRDEKLQSKLFGWPLFKAGYIALILQMAVGFGLMAAAGILPIMWAALIELVVFATVIAMSVVRDVAKETVLQSEAEISSQTEEWKAIRARANAIAAETNNPDIKKLAEDIRFSDPKPTPLDGQLFKMLEILSSYATADNIQKARILLSRRNEAAKANK